MSHKSKADSPLAVAVLISGRGSNLQAIIDARDSGRLNIDLRAVISNEPGARGLARAAQAGISNCVVDHHDYPQRVAFDEALVTCIDKIEPQLVVLAGFMRILGKAFVNHYAGRMINIHPSLLPAFSGLDTHRRALAAGVREHGASIHFVTPDLDGGPIIAQEKVPVYDGDTETQLAARVLEREHELLPAVIEGIARGRIRLEHGQVLVDERPVTL